VSKIPTRRNLFRVLGRGELQLAILIETCALKALMMVGKPEIVGAHRKRPQA